MELEVGAVKEWGPTGEATFNAESPMWDRFQRLGATLGAVAMDEPLCCVRSNLKRPAEYAVQETANFIALVRKRYPEVLIGDIEPAPFLSTPELIGWVEALQKRLADMGVRGLDFFRLDVDWVHYVHVVRLRHAPGERLRQCGRRPGPVRDRELDRRAVPERPGDRRVDLHALCAGLRAPLREARAVRDTWPNRCAVSEAPSSRRRGCG